MAFLIIKVLGSSSQSTGRSSSPQLQTPSLQDTPALPRSLYVWCHHWWGVCVFKQMSEVGDGCFDYFALLTRATWAIVVAGSTIEKGKLEAFPMWQTIIPNSWPSETNQAEKPIYKHCQKHNGPSPSFLIDCKFYAIYILKGRQKQ